MKAPTSIHLFRQLLPGYVFWSWNVIFVVFVSFGLFPLVLVGLLGGAIEGVVPPDFAIVSLLLTILPPLAIAVALKKFRGDGPRLLRFFYGVEAPLLAACLFRLFIFRELTPGTAHIGLIFLAGTAAYFVTLVKSEWKHPRIQLALHTLHALIGLYLGALLVFFVPPAAFGVLKMFGEALPQLWRELFRIHRIQEFFLIGIGIPLFLYSATLALGLPVALIVLSVGGVKRVFARSKSYVVASAVVALNLVFFWTANQQLQGKAFALLAGGAPGEAQRAALLANEDLLRKGLLNAYLSPYRYLATRGEADGLRKLYHDTLHLPERQAQAVQEAFNGVATPFLYDGVSVREDVKKAETLYEGFFDEAIQKAERPAINHALRSTYNRAEAEAGLLDTEAETVLVESQEVQIEAHGEVASVELHEVFANQTVTAAEVLYHFTLPEGAAVTGLWLGDTADRRVRFPFSVAPKGAAQRVYRAEVKRRVDPALLEQVGPRSYRLRAFPVPSRFSVEAGKPEPRLHLWLAYDTLRDRAGKEWPLPALVERRNAFWTGATTLTVNGQPVRRQKDEWLPAAAAAGVAMKASRHELSVGGTRLVAEPFEKRTETLRGAHLAVIVDRSLSMRAHKPELEAAIAALEGARKDGKWSIDYFLSGADAKLLPTGAPPLAAELRFYGATSPVAMLRQFGAASAAKAFDAALVLTDDNGFERREDGDAGGFAPKYPLWFVHLGGKFPPAYDDRILPLVQRNGGGASVGLDDALDRLGRARRLGREGCFAWDDHYEWRSAGPTLDDGAAKDGLATLGAARLIHARLADARPRTAADTRRLHDLAQRYGLVTPVSSMIVLVNDQQRAALKAAAGQANAFDADAETGKEALTTPFGDSLSATPEPEEWVLIAVGLAILGYSAAQRRRLRVPARLRSDGPREA